MSTNLYPYNDLQVMAECAEAAGIKNIGESGINIYVGAFGSDGTNYDIHIDPKDHNGIELFRLFAKAMVKHFTSLLPVSESVKCSWTGKNNEIIKVIGATSKDEALRAVTKFAGNTSIEEGYLFNWTHEGPQPEWWEDYYLFKVSASL